ncbi:MAG: PAS domain-containing sensor histidine kinase [Chloroflexota bacterium]
MSALGRLVGEWRPPIERREFWAVQALVVVIAGGHFLIEATSGELHAALAFIPTSLFLVPVVYAALSFGIHGSLPTALWSALVTVPNIVLLHDEGEQLGEVWQLGVVVLVAAFVGYRVDREKRARRDAEDREQARRISEEKYRGIFDHVAEPIMVLGPSCEIENANVAAAQLFSAGVSELRGRKVCDLLGIDFEQAVMRGEETREVRQLAINGARPRWVQPVLIPLSDAGGRPLTQLMLRDLTAEYERQHELEAYAQRTTEAREEERGRIARQLHDGPVQSLVLIWRRLDALEPLDDPELDRELRVAQRAVRDTADELRRVSRDLRPPILDDLGLAPALRAEINSFSQRTGIPARLICVGTERRLGPERELALLRIVQEALRNVGQHARAHRAAVRVQFEANRVRLSISDDGQGVEERRTAEFAANGKLGMIGMREQARLIDAAITIGNGRRGGAVVSVSLDA